MPEVAHDRDTYTTSNIAKYDLKPLGIQVYNSSKSFQIVSMYNVSLCYEPLVAQVAQNPGCSNTIVQVEYNV